MFNLQGSEIIIILLLALVVLGPEKLPDAMRKAGQFYAELRKMSSGFQSEFRAAVDEPMRELRDTANVLRDSADFTKLQDGDRSEKPKSATMEPADPAAVPVDAVPTFEPPAGDGGPATAAGSADAPFSDPSTREAFDGTDDAAGVADAEANVVDTTPTPVPAPPQPFSGMSANDEPAVSHGQRDSASADASDLLREADAIGDDDKQ